MMNHPAGILANEILPDLQRACRTCLGVVLEHFAPTDNAGIRRDLHEHPGVFQNKGFNFGDLDVVVRSNGGGVGSLGGEHCVHPKQRRGAEQSTE